MLNPNRAIRGKPNFMIPSWFPTKHSDFNNNNKCHLVSNPFKSTFFWPTLNINCFRHIAKVTEIANYYRTTYSVPLTNQRCSAIYWQANSCRIFPSFFCGIKDSDNTQGLNSGREAKQWFPSSTLSYNIYYNHMITGIKVSLE